MTKEDAKARCPKCVSNNCVYVRLGSRGWFVRQAKEQWVNLSYSAKFSHEPMSSYHGFHSSLWVNAPQAVAGFNTLGVALGNLGELGMRPGVLRWEGTRLKHAAACRAFSHWIVGVHNRSNTPVDFQHLRHSRTSLG